VGLLAALLALGMSSAPGRRELRWFALCAALAALLNLSNALVTVRAPLGLLLFASRLSMLLCGLHAAAWLKYGAAQEQRALRPLERAIVAGGVFLSVVALVPGVVLDDRLLEREVPWLGLTYADAAPTMLGQVALAYHAAVLAFVFVRYAERRLRGDRDCTVQCIAIGAVLAGTVHDGLASIGAIRGPYMLDAALLVMVLAVGGSLTRSFVGNARALEVSSQNLAIAQAELVNRERLAALGELAAVVAHEVRNPLAVIFNATAGLKKAAADSTDHRTLLGILQEEAERLRDIVSKLLEFARPRPPQFAPIAIDELMRSAIDAALGEAGAQADDVELEATDGLGQVWCDERLMRQALVNLVTNALQTTERRTPVRVAIETVDGWLVIRVADDGAGVAEVLRERIFTPFYSTRPTGTGLGLAVVRRGAEAHGGDVALTTTPGGGATFTFRLPHRRDSCVSE